MEAHQTQRWHVFQINSQRFLLDGPAVYAVISAFLFLATVLYTYSQSTGVSKFPLIGQNLGGFNKRRMYFGNHALELFLEGYEKFKDSVWRVTSSDGDVLVLPLRYVEELRDLPESVVSSNAANEMTFETKLLGITPENPLMVHVVRSDLTHNLSLINPSLADAVSQTVSDEIGTCKDWTEINISQKLLKIVAIVSGYVFLGPDLCRREEYLHASIDFTVDLFMAIAALKRQPESLRFIAKYWIPQIKTVDEHRRRVHNFLKPILRERRALQSKGAETPKDMLQWLLDKSGQFNIRTDEQLAETQLILGMAATHTTTMTATQIIYDLVGYCPQVIPELRDEINSALEANHGIMTTQALYQMKLLDSVMRESQRQNPSNMIRMQRRVLKPVRLSDGTRIPAGTSIAVPALPTLQDPTLYADPSRYDPYRFARLRAGDAPDLMHYTSKEMYQFIAVTKENMGFGYGRHACPGRFFAANEIKMICARVLLNYDIRLPDGVQGRYANVIRGSSITPDRSKTIMMRKRTT